MEPYILVRDMKELLKDPFIKEIDKLLLDLESTNIPEKIILYPETGKIERTMSQQYILTKKQLIELKNEHIRRHHAPK